LIAHVAALVACLLAEPAAPPADAAAPAPPPVEPAPAAPGADAPSAPPVEDAPAWPPPPPAPTAAPPAPLPPAAWPPPAPSAAAPALAPASVVVAAAGPLPRSGRFGLGLSLDLLQLGPLQVIGPGGTSSGVIGAIGVEVDLGPRAAVRLPLKIGGASASASTDPSSGVSESRSFVEVAFAPSLVYRLRARPRQRWIPFGTAGLDAGFFQFGRRLVGLAPSPKGTAQEFVRGGVAPQLGVGLIYAPSRLFGLRLAAEYTYFLLSSASVHALSETIAARFSF